MFLKIPTSVQAAILSHLSPADLCKLEQVLGNGPDAEKALEIGWKDLLVKRNEFMTLKALGERAIPEFYFKRLFAGLQNLVKSRYIFTSCKYSKMLMKKCAYRLLHPLFIDQISLIPQRREDHFDYRERLPDGHRLLLEGEGKGKGKAKMNDPFPLASIPIDAGHLRSYYIYGANIWFINGYHRLYSQMVEEPRYLTVHWEGSGLKDIKGSSLGYLLTRDESLSGITIWQITLHNLQTCHKKHVISSSNGETVRAFATRGSYLAILQGATVALFDIPSGKQITRIQNVPALYDSNLLFVEMDLTDDYLGLAASNEQESFFHVFKKDAHGFYSLVQSKKTTVTEHPFNTSFPTTFSIRNNFILTNGPKRNNFNLYHISPSSNTISLVSTLCEDIPNAANGFIRINQAQNDQDVAAIFVDDTTIIGVACSEISYRLLIWDFAIQRPCNRYFSWSKLGGLEGRIKMFVVYDDE